MMNPCLEYCYNRYNKQYTSDCDDKCEFAKTVKENKLLKEEMDIPIKTLKELTTQFCCLIECKNCPVEMHRYEKRTKHEKENIHIPCCDNLYKWVIEQAQEGRINL
ncbi:MAG: hypothetical protein NC489_19490 [Ruminococcus flavefaciens]|nr:hypothetical protein [Ruminococcus flavefaciens]